MGLSEAYDLIKKNGGKISLEDLFAQSYFGKNSVKTALRKLKWRNEIYFYTDLDGTEMVSIKGTSDKKVIGWPEKEQKIEDSKTKEN